MAHNSSVRSKANPKLAVAYLRVSTDVERQALGAEAQRTAIAEWSARSGVEVVASFVEQITGSAPLEKRPVLLQALAEVSVRRASALVVQRLDRFSRDPLTSALALAELRRHGATLVCADGAGSGDSPTDELIRGILVSVAKFEKSLIRARIRAALAVKKARGEYTGVAPYGFEVGEDKRTLVPHAKETAVLAEIRALRASGLTLRVLQAISAERGLLSRTGKPFTLAALHKMLSRTATSAPTHARAHAHANELTEDFMIKTMPTRAGTLTFSRRPDEAIYTDLKASNLDVWWNLALELDDLLPQMQECASEVLWAKIVDYSTPTDVPLFLEQLEHVCTRLRAGARVHVSCFGGRGRSSLALACVRVSLEEEDPTTAIATTLALARGPETVEQQAFIVEVHRMLRAR